MTPIKTMAFALATSAALAGCATNGYQDDRGSRALTGAGIGAAGGAAVGALTGGDVVAGAALGAAAGAVLGVVTSDRNRYQDRDGQRYYYEPDGRQYRYDERRRRRYQPG